MKVIKTFRKTLALQIKDGELIVRAPVFVLNSTIQKFVLKHESWIQKKLNQTKNYKKITDSEKRELICKAKKYIPERVKFLASEHWFCYNRISITSAQKRWWSCSSNRNLNFSYRLILTPKDVIDYVIIHELAHLKYMNHSKQFWKLVENMMPSYKDKEKYLKNFIA